MKGTEKIIAHIRSDAEEQANAILAEAAEQCAAIKSGCEEQAKDTYAERIRAGVKECESRADSMKRMAQMESRKGVLALKQELVSASFDKAVEMIVALPREQYVSLLAKLASEAAVTGSEEIVLNARDRETIGADVVKAADALFKGGSFSLSDETGSFAGGLILRRGSVAANCTAELLVELQRSGMASEIAKVLFDCCGCTIPYREGINCQQKKKRTSACPRWSAPRSRSSSTPTEPTVCSRPRPMRRRQRC